MAEVGRFQLTVRDPNNRPYHIPVTPESTVWQVKRDLRQKSQYMGALDIIFNGDILQDDKSLRNLGIFSTSTLHCVKSVGRPTTGKVVEGIKKLDLASLPTDVGKGSPSTPPSSDDDAHQFYVYCKDPCGSIAPGKLRVRCANCRDGRFILDEEPSGWEDILIKRKMTGVCHQGNCNGRAAEFYFKCASHDTGEDDTSPALPMFRRNNYNIECPLCAEVRPLVAVYQCPDLHSVCVDCFIEYCKTALKQRNFIKDKEGWFTISCPFPGHEDYVVRDIHHFRILGEKDYQRYKDLATVQMLLQMGGVLCPKKGCGEGLLPEHTNRRIQCQSCKHVFCRECKENYHPGQCSFKSQAEAPVQGGRKDVNTQAFRNARWNEANQKYLKDNTKPCPQCRASTEKNGGCNHITCTVCKHEWCWLCLKKWGRGCMDDHWFA